MIDRSTAVDRGIKAKAMLYDRNRKDDTQLHWLYDLAAMAPDGIAVECGVYLGGSLVCWAAAREGRGQIVAVDNWSSFNAHSEGKQIFLDNLERYGIDARVLEVATCDAPALIDGEVSFCFIDSGHGEDGIPHDIKVWPDKIMPGGILASHDYGVWKPGVVVKREVDAWQAKAQWEYLGIVGALIAFRRPL
jgi:predicted O-methyltransferase YrrM